MPDIRSNPIEIMARLGYGARGVVYGLVGGLALLAAIGSGGQTGGSRSALRSLVGQPLGKVWLTLIAIGLVGFCAWRVLEAITDADHRGDDAKGLAVRGAHLISGIIYAGLAFSALSLAFGWGSPSGGEDQAAQGWTAWLMSKPFGQWLLGLAGTAVAGAGIGFLFRAWRGNVAEQLSLPGDKRDWFITIGRIGFAARGLVFLIIGGFMITAAIQSSSSQVRGLGGALEALQQQPYGWILLAVTALGLFAFGVFGLIQARYRRIDAPDMDDARAAAARLGSH